MVRLAKIIFFYIMSKELPYVPIFMAQQPIYTMCKLVA